MQTLVIQPLRDVVASSIRSSRLTVVRNRRLLVGVVEFLTLAAILATLAIAVVRIH